MKLLREAGYEVYDFKDPTDKNGPIFHWEDVDVNYRNWTVKDYQEELYDGESLGGYARTYGAMLDSNVCVLLLPCGRSAHTEAGFLKGIGRKVYVVMEELEEPEVMYTLFDGVCDGPEELLKMLKE